MAQPAFPTPAQTPRQRRLSRRWIAWGLLIAALALAWFWQPITRSATTAASYGAHVACSCRFIAGRPLDQCRADFESGMGPVTLSEDDEAKTVTARYPLLATQTATYIPGRGCLLESW